VVEEKFHFLKQGYPFQKVFLKHVLCSCVEKYVVCACIEKHVVYALNKNLH
jgi:hypothetical protein